MTSIAAYNLLKAAVKSDYFSAFVVCAAWLAALMSGSVLAILIGLIAYARPLLLGALVSKSSPKNAVKKPATTKAGFFASLSLRPFALGLAG